MKTFAIFFAVCVGLTCASMRLPTDWSFLKPLAQNVVRNTIGIDIADFNGVRNLLSGADSEAARESILGAAATAFLAKFRNGPFLSGKSAAQIMADFKTNAIDVLSGPIDPSWQPTLNNEVMGLSQQEFQGLLGTQVENRTASRGSGNVGSSRSKRQVSSLPKSVDWRTKGAVTPVKNQKQCGSCWAFAAVGALEGRLGVKTGKATVLSEQHLVDCAKNVNGTECCQGCDGGRMTEGYSFVQMNKGINTEAEYPYVAKDDKCKKNAVNSALNSVGYEYTEQDDEDDLMRAVAEGPVAVTVDANKWSSYGSGIFRCRGIITKIISPLKMNHGVVVVGYGTETGLFGGGDYWLVKNSWGDSWGEKGYIKIARKDGNQCGIASQASYPLV